MSILEIILVGVGLAADAFAVSVCKGLSIRKIDIKKMTVVGLYFGIFQALMPLIGFLIGSAFSQYIVAIDHWLAFVLLAFIGGKMLFEAVKKEQSPQECTEEEMKKAASLSFKSMVTLAVATSIDALAVGVSFSFVNVNIYVAIAIIGAITFLICFLGVKIGNVFGNKFQAKAEIAGGVILILIGLKILLEGLNIIHF